MTQEEEILQLQKLIKERETQIADIQEAKRNYLDRCRENATAYINNITGSVQEIYEEELVFINEPLMFSQEFRKPIKKYEKKTKKNFDKIAQETKLVSNRFINEHLAEMLEGKQTGNDIIANQSIQFLELLIVAKRELVGDLNSFRYRNNPNKFPLIELIEGNIKAYQEKIENLKRV